MGYVGAIKCGAARTWRSSNNAARIRDHRSSAVYCSALFFSESKKRATTAVSTHCVHVARPCVRFRCGMSKISPIARRPHQGGCGRIGLI